MPRQPRLPAANGMKTRFMAVSCSSGVSSQRSGVYLVGSGKKRVSYALRVGVMETRDLCAGVSGDVV